MPKFLKTTGVSHYLELLIDSSMERLILISPYLKFNQRIKSILEDKDRLKIDIRLIYGKSELNPEEYNWIRGLKSIRTGFLTNLHAKCYMNESQAILTSMNLYEFSQINNQEMGILIQKEEDSDLYQEIYDEVMRLVRESDEIEVTVAKVPKEREKENIIPKSQKRKKISNDKDSNSTGFCIRCKTEVKLNPLVPYCKKCYNSWKKYENDDYEENYCHICGKENFSTLIKPSCYPCYKSNKNKLEFPMAEIG